jgi:hypothetical protein
MVRKWHTHPTGSPPNPNLKLRVTNLSASRVQADKTHSTLNYLFPLLIKHAYEEILLFAEEE